VKQLTIFCSADLEHRVLTALERAGVSAFLRLDRVSGCRFNDPGRVPRTISWEALAFLVPGAEDDRVDAVVEELEVYAGACDIQPCLRLAVSPVERIV
jgi:hypothetical protein